MDKAHTGSALILLPTSAHHPLGDCSAWGQPSAAKTASAPGVREHWGHWIWVGSGSH